MATNWAGNITYTAQSIRAPRSVSELQEIVGAADRVRALGSRHSFTELTDTSGTLVELGRLPLDLHLDTDGEQPTMSVNAGARYGDIVELLDREGWALANLASLPHISIAGAVATGTHGSGVGNPSLSAAVTAVEVVNPDGSLRQVRRGDPTFPGEVVALGALGVISRISLAIEPRYEMRQQVHLDLPFQQLGERFDDLAAAAYSVSFFVDFERDTVAQVWHKSRAGEQPVAPPGTHLPDGPRHMLRDVDPRAVTSQDGTLGPWYQRLPHFRLEFTPSNGEELQSEYFVRHTDGPAAIEALRGLAARSDRLSSVMQAAEIRTIAADDLWLSPSTGYDCVAFHFTWLPDTERVTAVLPEMEEALRPFAARPHWGKVFTMPGVEVRALYPEFDRFATLRDEIDPERKFGNAFLTELLGG